MKTVICLITAVVLTGVADAQQLFVGLEIGTTPALPTKSTDLAGFPEVTYTNHFKLDTSGAARARRDARTAGRRAGGGARGG